MSAQRNVECLGDLGESEESLIHAFNHAIFFGIFGVYKAITFELFVQMKAY